MKLFRIKFASFLMATALACFISLASGSAYAQVAGCDPNKLDHMKDRAVLKVGDAMGCAQEIIRKMDSVVAMTCWPEAAQISANEGGNIFSGAFEGELNNVIGDMVDEMLNQFVGSFLESMGTLGGIIGSWFGWGGPGTFSCTHMQDMWDDVVTRGINQACEFLDLDALIAVAQSPSGVPFSASEFVDANLRALGGAGNVADRINTVLTTPPTPVPNYVGANSVCAVQVLNNGGPVPGCP